MYNPSASPSCCPTSWQHCYKHHHRWCPGTSHEHRTVHELPKPGRNTEFCSISLPPAISVIHSSSFPHSYLLIWHQKLGFQTLPSQAPLILQPTLLLPLRRHPSFPKTSIQTTLFKGDKLYPNMPYPSPKNKEKYMGHREKSSQSSYNYSCR